MDTLTTIEGTIGSALWFHFDLGNDVLYLRLNSLLDTEVFGEETPEGFILLRTDEDQIAGMTIVNYWQRFGAGELQNLPLSRLQTFITKQARTLERRLAA